MAFGVGDGLLAVSSVGQCEGQTTHVPFIVGFLLQPFDVHVWDGHGESIVESDTAECVWETQSRHAGHILGDGNAIGVELVQHVVGEGEVCHTLFVDAGTEVLVVSAGEAAVGSY